MVKKRSNISRKVSSQKKVSSRSGKVSREKQRTSAEIVYLITVVAVLILHYFVISKTGVAQTGQVFIDFLIVFIVVGIFTTFTRIKLKRNRNGFDILFFLFAVATLVINYFWISRIAIASVWQVFLDFVIFTALCGIVMIVFCEMKKR